MARQIKRPKILIHAILGGIFIVLLVATIIANQVFGTVLRAALASSTLDDEMMETARDSALETNRKLEAEGAVLLRNENNTLPIDTSSKVKINVFGFKATDFVYNANGSAAGSTSDAVTLKQGLEQAGFEINETLWNAIDSYNKEKGENSSDVHEGDTDLSLYPINELPEEKYTGDISFSALKSYSDIAVVNLGRVAGEGQDIPRTGFGADKQGHYLQLSSDEQKLFSNLKQNGFKVIVLVNSSYAFELGFLEDYDIDACLWIGGPGVAGCTAVGQILNGEVVPSGRLADTWAYDLTTSSTFYTADSYKYAEQSGDSYKDIGGFSYYAEGIYMGYRWYETADAVGYWDSVSNAYGTGYDGVVQFPFGYGLSYTAFEQKFASAPAVSGDSITFTVEVTNTGDTYSGKDVVQLYVEAPYYEGGVEKSKVSLCAFGKTDILAPGASETVELTVALEDLASYSTQADDGNGAYLLEDGTYSFYLSTDSHSWKSISPSDPERYFAYEQGGAIVYSGSNKRESDVQAAQNQFSVNQNGNWFDLEGDMEPLSRAGGFANASVLSKTYSQIELSGSTVNGIVLDSGSALYKALVTDMKVWGTYRGTSTDATVKGSKRYSFEDMYDKDYDDPAWNVFISQLTVDEMQTLIANGGWSTAEIKSIGKPMTTDIDGPFGLSNYIKSSMGVEQKCVSYCTEVVTASTWNVELWREFGEAVGMEANASGTAGWYAPGANTHRSPFSGRNAEYYSEDPLLSGIACANVVAGAQSKGLYVYVKHFAFNDQEANRTNYENCWMTEQTAREIYLKPFEYAVKQGGAKGLMVSYMYTNGVWNGGNYSLMTQVVRKEWGFNGVVITDNYCGSFMGATKAVMAGTDLILSAAPRTVDASVASTTEGILAMKDACKHILYAIASVQNNRLVPLVAATNWWNVAFIALICVSVAGLVIDVGIYVIRILVYLKQGRGKTEQETV